MLEALFGGLFSFVVRVGTRLIEKAVEIVGEELGLSSSRSGRSFISSAANKLQDIAGEISGRERSLAQRPNAADQQALENLQAQRRQALLEYEQAQQQTASAELAGAPDAFTESRLMPGGENKLLYHVGLVTLKKECSVCSRPMKLQHRTVQSPQFTDFFWQCTGFYGGHCHRTQQFAPNDLALLHKTDIPEIAIDNVDLTTIASDARIQKSTGRRVSSHLGQTDLDILCPVHATPMVLREKHGPDDLPLLDRYHLRCPQHPCSQTTKLKSYPQLASFLRRKEGVGILH